MCVTVLELLTSSPSGLDDAQQQVASYEEKIKKLEQTLGIEKIKKAEAINKLTQVWGRTLFVKLLTVLISEHVARHSSCQSLPLFHR